MKKLITIKNAAFALLLGITALLWSCEESFEDGGFETDGSVNVTAFRIDGTDGDIDNATGQITVTLPYGSSIMGLTPEIILPEGAVMEPQITNPVNFNEPLEFRVINGNIYKDYTAVVNVVKPILSFTVNDVAATINHTNKTINLTLPAGTDLTALQPQIEVSEGVTVSPASGETINFTEPVIFTVSSGNLTEEYTANVTVPVEGLVVAFLGTAPTKEDITNMDEKTAANWLFANYGGATYLSFAQIQAGADLSAIDLIWWHYDSAASLPAVAFNPAVTSSLQNYRSNGGNLLLTTFASQYVEALGIVPSGKGPNNVFGDFPPAGFVDGNAWGITFAGHESHPIFQNLETFEGNKANLLSAGTFRLNHTAWWFLPEWGGYGDGQGWRDQTGGTNLASEPWDTGLNGRVVIAEWPGNGNDKNVIVISLGAYDWYNEADSNGTPSQPNIFISNIQTLTQNSINYLIEN